MSGNIENSNEIELSRAKDRFNIRKESLEKDLKRDDLFDKEDNEVRTP